MNIGLHARAALAAASVFTALAAWPAAAQTNAKFSLDFTLQGSQAPFFLARDRGYYAAGGVNVTAIDVGRGSGDTVNRVASGTYDLGFGDINSLVEFDSKNPGKEFPAVLMIYNKAPMSIITLKKSGISTPKALVGKKGAAPSFDASYRMFDMFAKINGFDPKSMTWSNVAPQLREPMLARGEADAISSFTFTSTFALETLGVPESSLNIMKYSDYGLDLYSNAIMASPEFLKSNPKAVAGFVKGAIRGWQDAIKDPQAAIAAIKKADPLVNEQLELERLKVTIRDFVLSDEVKKNGMGDVDDARMEKAIGYVTEGLGLPRKLAPKDVFDRQFLPPAAERKLM
ncbi:MAG TPA: ABC transporter substrate-binding protein [Alphaproteobacteria bacterium]|nr:ABC transporter substrate-binding protein [Alphaproteobacteria bacterium]